MLCISIYIHIYTQEEEEEKRIFSISDEVHLLFLYFYYYDMHCVYEYKCVWMCVLGVYMREYECVELDMHSCI